MAAPGDMIVLDGGMGHQLKSMGVKIEGPVGTMRRFLGVAMANVDQPEMVRDAHLAYIDAGADVVTTNNYACVPRCLNEEGQLEGGIEEYIAAAGKCARDACAMRPDRKLMVAGSMPPLGATYRPEEVGKFEDNLNQYKTIAATLAEYADVLICETMSTAEEAQAACTAAVETGKPVWVAWTLDESKCQLRSGESIEEAAAAVLKVPGADKLLQACIFNCTSPEIICEAMPKLRAALPEGIKVGAYANGFLTASSGAGEYRDISPEEYFKFVSKWMESGATVVGGCCGIFPPHIAAIRAGIDAAK